MRIILPRTVFIYLWLSRTMKTMKKRYRLLFVICTGLSCVIGIFVFTSLLFTTKPLLTWIEPICKPGAFINT